jgi:3-oxoacyl-[acyl-carrier-protein] synthase III
VTSLDAVAVHLPARRFTLEQLGARLDLTDRQIRLMRRFHGLGEVRLDPDGSLLDLLSRAVAALAPLRGREHHVRYVLHARSVPVAAPYPANPLHELCRAFGLAHAAAFTVTHQACATGLLAIDVAGRLLQDEDDPEALALVVAGEKTFTRDAQIVPETSVFGEGAAACLVRADGPRDRVLSYVAHLHGEYDGRLAEDPDLLARFQRDYPALLADAILDAVARAGLDLADVRLILPHNVNAVSWQRLCRRIGFPVERVVLENVARIGHSFSADAFINHRTAGERGLLGPGDRYVMAAAGLGATFSAMVFEH